MHGTDCYKCRIIRSPRLFNSSIVHSPLSPRSRSISVAWSLAADGECPNNTVIVSLSSSPASTEWREVLQCGGGSCTTSSSWDPVVCSEEAVCGVASPAGLLQPCSRYRLEVRRGDRAETRMLTTDEETPGRPEVVGTQEVAPALGGWEGGGFLVGWGPVSHLPQCVAGYRVSLGWYYVYEQNGFQLQKDEIWYRDIEGRETGREVRVDAYLSSSDSKQYYELSVQAITAKKRLGEANVKRGFLYGGGIPDPDHPQPIYIGPSTTTTTTKSK